MAATGRKEAKLLNQVVWREIKRRSYIYRKCCVIRCMVVGERSVHQSYARNSHHNDLPLYCQNPMVLVVRQIQAWTLGWMRRTCLTDLAGVLTIYHLYHSSRSIEVPLLPLCTVGTKDWRASTQ